MSQGVLGSESSVVLKPSPGRTGVMIKLWSAPHVCVCVCVCVCEREREREMAQVLPRIIRPTRFITLMCVCVCVCVCVYIYMCVCVCVGVCVCV